MYSIFKPSALIPLTGVGLWATLTNNIYVLVTLIAVSIFIIGLLTYRHFKVEKDYQPEHALTNNKKER